MGQYHNNQNYGQQNYGQQNYGQPNYMGQVMMAPHMMNFNQLPTQLPIPNQMNTWPPQRWVVNPNGPTGYESYDPFGQGTRSYFNKPGAMGVSNDPYMMYQKGYMEGVKNAESQDYQMVNGKIRESFSNGPKTRMQALTDSVLEYFGSGSQNQYQDQGYQLLQMVIFILVVLFIIQLVEILVNNRTSVEIE